jgi:hypothetical protein
MNKRMLFKQTMLINSVAPRFKVPSEVLDFNFASQNRADPMGVYSPPHMKPFPFALSCH